MHFEPISIQPKLNLSVSATNSNFPFTSKTEQDHSISFIQPGNEDVQVSYE